MRASSSDLDRMCEAGTPRDDISAPTKPLQSIPHLPRLLPAQEHEQPQARSRAVPREGSQARPGEGQCQGAPDIASALSQLHLFIQIEKKLEEERKLAAEKAERECRMTSSIPSQSPYNHGYSPQWTRSPVIPRYAPFQLGYHLPANSAGVCRESPDLASSDLRSDEVNKGITSRHQPLTCTNQNRPQLLHNNAVTQPNNQSLVMGYRAGVPRFVNTTMFVGGQLHSSGGTPHQIPPRFAPSAPCNGTFKSQQFGTSPWQNPYQQVPYYPFYPNKVPPVVCSTTPFTPPSMAPQVPR